MVDLRAVNALHALDDGDVSELVSLLRSDADLDRYFRNRLADMLDPASNTPHKLVINRKAVGRPRNSGASKNLDIGAEIERMIDEGVKTDAAVFETASRHGVSERTARESLSHYRKAKAEHDAALDE